ncbi:hypothetical protein HanIR_Chr14g0712241 [Helianthus annuus]|nr:hypothetical protein HanIR_Chr14g0712241 [Helianthus annuus]
MIRSYDLQVWLSERIFQSGSWNPYHCFFNMVSKYRWDQEESFYVMASGNGSQLVTNIEEINIATLKRESKPRYHINNSRH